MTRSRPTFSILAAGAGLALILLFTTVDPWLDKAGILAGGLDAHIYRDGALKALHGDPLYTEPTLYGLLYTYTPFSAIAFIPIAVVPWGYVTYTWLLLNLAALYGCVLSSWRLLGYRLTGRLAAVSALLAMTCLFLEPVRTTLFYGQINLMLMLVVLWSFARPESSRTRGVGVGVAAGIKLVPGYFIIQFFALRQWRSAGIAAATFAGTAMLAGIALPGDSRQYWLRTFFESDRIAPDDNPANQSIRGTIAHLSHGAAPVWWWLAIAGVVAVASLILTSALYRRGEQLLAVTIAGLTACAVSPFSWGHHWVWFVPLFVYLVHRAQSRARWWIVAVVLFGVLGAWSYRWNEDYVSIGLFLYPQWWTIAPLLLNIYVIVYMIVLVFALRKTLPPSIFHRIQRRGD
ncbi:glycosyltransferase 87 family protein [Nocardia crassostreae]|uniref:glycosyltransferase 87 family protein n=1 Tax=Nocardia crassostreae TaxID=53428 RepID=UPI001FE16690|nr:glycosyltransferase 87 family protein [Nocardia crassostreae]